MQLKVGCKRNKMKAHIYYQARKKTTRGLRPRYRSSQTYDSSFFRQNIEENMYRPFWIQIRPTISLPEKKKQCVNTISNQTCHCLFGADYVHQFMIENTELELALTLVL